LEKNGSKDFTWEVIATYSRTGRKELARVLAKETVRSHYVMAMLEM
jgi:hypothetical protein